MKATDIADGLYEDVRALSVNVMARPVPGQELYELVGNLKYALGHYADELLGRLAYALARSLDELEVREDDGADPALRVAEAIGFLGDAATHAREIGLLLEQVQSAVSRQVGVPARGDMSRDAS